MPFRLALPSPARATPAPVLWRNLITPWKRRKKREQGREKGKSMSPPCPVENSFQNHGSPRSYSLSRFVLFAIVRPRWIPERTEAPSVLSLIRVPAAARAAARGRDKKYGNAFAFVRQNANFLLVRLSPSRYPRYKALVGRDLIETLHSGGGSRESRLRRSRCGRRRVCQVGDSPRDLPFRGRLARDCNCQECSSPPRPAGRAASPLIAIVRETPLIVTRARRAPRNAANARNL